MKILDRKSTVRSVYDFSASLQVKDSDYCKFLDSYFLMGTTYDSPNGDATTYYLDEFLPKSQTYIVFAKERLCCSGLEEIQYFCKNLGLAFEPRCSDGDFVESGSILALIGGHVQTILRYERFLLNVLQRMCGIATATSAFHTTYVKVAGTRKTPLYYLDKKAIFCGDGFTHRLSLNDSLFFKDTHFDVVGRNFKKLSEYIKSHPINSCITSVTVEVADTAEAIQVAEMSRQLDLPIPCVALLDNFEPHEVCETLSELERQTLTDYILIEVSGGVTSKNYQLFDIVGVDVISIGALTHSSKASDISMKLQK